MDSLGADPQSEKDLEANGVYQPTRSHPDSAQGIQSLKPMTYLMLTVTSKFYVFCSLKTEYPLGRCANFPPEEGINVGSG